MNERVVYWNGKMIPERDAKVSIYDSALMFGDTVFDMTRSFNKEQFKLREHLERLYYSAKCVRMPLEMSMHEMEEHIYEVVDANDPLFEKDDEHRIMINVTRGLLSIYEDVVGVEKGINVIIADFPLRWTVSSMARLFDTGVNAVVPSQRAIPAHLLDPKIKNRSRIHYLMANIEVSQVAGNNNWALLLDPDGFVAEGTGDNFFFVKDGVLVTPEGRNILRGISRNYILDELAPQLGIPCVTKNFGLFDVVNADEAFYTGTPFCIMPCTSINGIHIGDGITKMFPCRSGEITHELIMQWGENVGVPIVEQIQKWAKNSNSSAPSPYQFKENTLPSQNWRRSDL
jgi:branched-chain amino acid aminotransferase